MPNKYFMKKLSRISLVIFMLGLTEAIGRSLWSPPLREIYTRKPNLFEKKTETLRENRRSTHVTETIEGHDGKKFISTHHLDLYGRRVNPANSQKKQKAVVFLGASVTYGKGLNDDETLGFFFSKQSDTYNVYDYSVEGWSTQQYLGLINNRTLKNEILEPIDTIFIFISLNTQYGHVQRFIGGYDLCAPCAWLKILPLYEKTSNERFQYRGSFRIARPIHYFFYDIAQRSFLLNQLMILFRTTQHSESHKYSEFLQFFLTEIKTKFPDSNIILVNHPKSDKESSKIFNQTFDPSYITYFDYYSLTSLQDRRHFKDEPKGVPTVYFNKMFASILQRDLQKTVDKQKVDGF